MSDKPIIDDPPNDDVTLPADDWVAPTPVFRTTEGHTPKSGNGGSLADLSADDEVPTDIPDEVATAITEEIPAYEPKVKGGLFGSFFFILMMIALLAAGIIAAVYYFLFYVRPADTTTF